MKPLFMLLFSSLLLVSTVQAQGKKTTRKRPVKSFRQDHPNASYRNNPTPEPVYNYGLPPTAMSDNVRQWDSTYTFQTRKKYGGWSRPINESTTGVMGHDEIKMNEKGEYRNLNSNTGIPLPPNNGSQL